MYGLTHTAAPAAHNPTAYGYSSFGTGYTQGVHELHAHNVAMPTFAPLPPPQAAYSPNPYASYALA
eukprot:NODE_3795_length_522_cov_59.399577_g3230_i0.p2 GENE.NODE_3795_length_522_cov_59.399577_g3230_i0~~NODE_3795_length_522_cov_59.399577_g3230_i0.p2  ORF type:complete len:66 (-),score=11.68 NODE_3795_length_522_cov_59.399577_g3230_i0:177-374(-)